MARLQKIDEVCPQAQPTTIRDIRDMTGLHSSEDQGRPGGIPKSPKPKVWKTAHGPRLDEGLRLTGPHVLLHPGGLSSAKLPNHHKKTNRKKKKKKNSDKNKSKYNLKYNNYSNYSGL